MASYSNTINKVKITITLNRDITNTLDEFARKKEIPRSQAIEGILKDWISNSRRRSIENEIKNYYYSLSEEEKEEDKLWLKVAEKNAEGLWDD
ncbi:MAG: hypothetical protein FJW68_08435 [Actinobacteria bacterium]|nr:hypothetical protein [Actinomycetota bacterium]